MLQLSAEHEEHADPLGADLPAERTRDYSRLTRAEVASLLALHRAGKTQDQIAETLGCNRSTVSRWLTELADTSDLAKHTLRAGAVKLARRVIKDADVDQSLEVLDRIGVAEKRQAEKGSQVQVLVGVNLSPSVS